MSAQYGVRPRVQKEGFRAARAGFARIRIPMPQAKALEHDGFPHQSTPGPFQAAPPGPVGVPQSAAICRRLSAVRETSMGQSPRRSL
jgi:hypothetical protein